MDSRSSRGAAAPPVAVPWSPETHRAPVALRDAVASAAVISDACQVVAEALAGQGALAVTVLLRIDSVLHSYGIAGEVCRVPYVTPPKAGAIGVALESGTAAVDEPVDPAGAPYPATELTRAVLCVPIPDAAHGAVGVLKIELADGADVGRLRQAAESIAPALTDRILDLGYSGLETPAERLVRRAFEMATGSDRDKLINDVLRTGREVAGMDTAVGIVQSPGSAPTLLRESGRDTRLAGLARSLNRGQIEELTGFAERFGTWFTATSPAAALASATRALFEGGARTVIAVPIGYGLLPRTDPSRRLLLLLDERSLRPLPATLGLLQLLSAQAQVSMTRMDLLERLRDLAGRDPLTGLAHQGPLATRMERTIPEHTALLLMDVDNFKRINDRRGHAAGDRVLRNLAHSLSNVLRPGDELYRIGGDEFVAVLDVVSPAQAERIGDRLVRAARQAGCTISLGVSLQEAGESADGALRRADTAMYRAKSDGRDRMRVAAGTRDRSR